VCDYSLYAVRQRLACEGDELVTYRFETGSIGFASASEVQSRKTGEPPHAGGLMRWFVDWLRMSPVCNVTAVCMPPGARVELCVENREIQRSLGISGRCEAVFDEITADSFMYRDALRLPDGRVLLLQSIPEGIQARVLTLGSSRSPEDAILLDAVEDFRRPAVATQRW
jgi:hypothetical protein